MQYRFTLSLGILLLVFASLSPASADPKRILILSSFGRDFSPWAEFTKKLRAELEQRSPEPIEFHDASLVTARFAANQDERPFVEYLGALFANYPLDLIVAVGAPAARFVQQYRQQIFPSTPMLFTGVEERRVSLTSLAANDTVTALSIDFESAFENILRVLPETTHIAVVTGNSPNELFWREQVLNASQPYAARLAFSWFSDLSFDEMLKRAATLPPNSAILYLLVLVDAAGVSHEGGKSFARLRAVANAPMFSYIDTHFGDGLIGGPIISVDEVAHRAANVVTRMLSGEAPSGIKTTPIGPGVPKFDWRELQRWNISEARLPLGSEIHFRPPSMWEQYRLQMAAGLAVLIYQSALIGWLLIERRRRQLAEFESRGRLREVMHLDRVAAIGAMSASLSHELNQPLGAILANAETAEFLLEATSIDRGTLKEILADIRQADQRAADIIAHLRGLLKKQDASELKEFDLNDALRKALHTLGPEARKRGVLIGTDQVQGPLPVRADQVHLEQVILNLAMNAMDAMQESDAGTRKLLVQTALAGKSEAEVSVSDSGTGIPHDKLTSIFDTFYTTKQQGTGLGLSIVRTIVENCGGRIWAENRPEGGAVIRFTLPLTTAQPA
jgi:signal transduction histidine kinase